MELANIDWIIIALFFIISLGIGLAVAKKSGKSYEEFFLSGRNMPWWMLGISMVATTFAADTPNLVTQLVRENGVAGNWVWWAFLFTGMLTVFVYARLWRRSGVGTDLEFYELRYSGKEASFLRGFRAIYLGVFFNVIIMATVMLAAIKIGDILLGVSALETVLVASIATVFYTALGGLRGVILTDIFQFIIAMIGTVAAAIYIVNIPEVGGLDHLLAQANVQAKMDIFPDFNNPEVYIPLFIIPIAVQWWNVWYPGAEPGGGGYVAQRMLSAKDEKHAIGATLLFNVAHYALRPWPWILIALASLVVYPDLASLSEAFPNVSDTQLKDDLAYPAMLRYLPKGLLGIVIASLIAALLSTLSTHLNWGSSYIVNDFYKRFFDNNASNKKLVSLGRWATVGLMILSAFLALAMESALQGFNILLQIGAGTGLIFILRWFWWRINAYSEIVAMIVSFVIALFFEFVETGLAGHEKLLVGIGITTIAWVTTTLLTQPTNKKTLYRFYNIIKPHATGWRPIIDQGIKEGAIDSKKLGTNQLPMELLQMFLGTCMVYAALFATGWWIYGQTSAAIIATIVSIVTAFALWFNWKAVERNNTDFTK